VVCAALALLVGAACLPHGDRIAPSAADELMYFPSGTLLRPASLGYDTLMSDLCWLEAVQYYGHHRLTDRVYTSAAHIFDTIVQLDPAFTSAYVFGALVLAQDAHEPAAALRLLERGMHEMPDRWELPFEAGFVHFVIRRDPAAAEPCFRRAAACTDAPAIARRFAAWTALRSGDRAAAIRMWDAIARTADTPALRDAAARYVARLRAEEGM
jgi:hypothetical protein